MGPDAVSFQMKALCFEEKGDKFNAAVHFGYMKKAQGKNDEAVVEFNHAHSLNKKDKNVFWRTSAFRYGASGLPYAHGGQCAAFHVGARVVLH